MAELWAIWLFVTLVIYLGIAQKALLGWRKNLVEIESAPLPIHIIIPAHNEAKCIGLLLDDLTKQEPDPEIPFRVIVVDDRSTDRTSQIVEQYRDRLPIEILRIEQLPKGVHGKLFAMYKATAELTEGSVLMVDADCRVGPRWVSTLAREAGAGGTVGPVFEVGQKPGLLREMLTDDQAAITFAAMGLIARSYPLTASTANMLIPVSSIRDGLWEHIGTDGTGEDGRILQDQYTRGKPMRAAIHPDATVLTNLAPTFRATAATRRRWYQDAMTYQPSVQASHVVIGLTLLGLASAIPALFFCSVWKFGLAVLLAKLVNDLVIWRYVHPFFSAVTLRSVLIWSPLQAWFLISYALLPPPKVRQCRGFADQ